MVIFALAVKEKRTAMTTVARRIFLEIKTGRLSLYSHARRQLSYKVLTLPRNFSRFFWALTEKFAEKKSKPKQNRTKQNKKRKQKPNTKQTKPTTKEQTI